MEIEHRILFEDNHLIVVNKKSGELSQGDITNDFTLPDLIKSYLKKQLMSTSSMLKIKRNKCDASKLGAN